MLSKLNTADHPLPHPKLSPLYQLQRLSMSPVIQLGEAECASEDAQVPTT
jgi:hypothetical protein